MMMSGIGGFELSQQFKAANPRLKVIAISGFEGGNLDGGRKCLDCFIKKPFYGNLLLTVIRQRPELKNSL